MTAFILYNIIRKFFPVIQRLKNNIYCSFPYSKSNTESVSAMQKICKTQRNKAKNTYQPTTKLSTINILANILPVFSLHAYL